MADRVHELKCWPSFFAAILDGSKTFEVRKNDRDFAVGDVLKLREWEPYAFGEWGTVRTGNYTKRECVRRVTYVLRGGEFGIEAGTVVLGLAMDAERQKRLTPAEREDEGCARCGKKWPKGTMFYMHEGAPHCSVACVDAVKRAAMSAPVAAETPSPLPPVGPDLDGTRLEMTPNGDGAVRITAHNDPAKPDARDAELAKLRAELATALVAAGEAREHAEELIARANQQRAELAKLWVVVEAAARLQRWNDDDRGGDDEGEAARRALSQALDAACPGWRAKEAGR